MKQRRLRIRFVDVSLRPADSALVFVLLFFIVWGRTRFAGANLNITLLNPRAPALGVLEQWDNVCPTNGPLPCQNLNVAVICPHMWDRGILKVYTFFGIMLVLFEAAYLKAPWLGGVS